MIFILNQKAKINFKKKSMKKKQSHFNKAKKHFYINQSKNIKAKTQNDK